MSSLQPAKKRVKKSSASTSASRQQASLQRQQPHPLRHSILANDLASDGLAPDEDDATNELITPSYNAEDDDDDDFDVTRQAISRGGNAGDNDDDDEYDDDDDDRGLFNFSSIKLKIPVINQGLSHSGSSHAANDELDDNMFPSPHAFGLGGGSEQSGTQTGSKPGTQSLDNNLQVNGGHNQAVKRKKKQFGAGMTADQVKVLISSFTDDQMERYETFRRANINRGGVKKLANAVLNQSITNQVAVAISGFSKVFIGEVIERALDAQERMDPRDRKSTDEVIRPLRPEHIREAWRLYKQETGLIPEAQWRYSSGLGNGKMFR
ncbi:hTAFII28-like protein conserved region-domain-containing protein [Lipomyces japonicus]|uniref:hTAFII28-like protein conserved region-domain-containing protein n=1 Tax=Lipomyces japonicus TaxID=56871 RepID=UPI0034CDCEDE